MRLAPALILAAVLSLLSVGAPGTGSGAGEDLLSLLPKEADIAGLKGRSAPEFYEPHNLFDYIDGQADVYLDYGFNLLIAREYSAGADSVVTLEIYRMESPLHAFGIYAAERTPEDKDIGLGVQGFQGANVLGFWKGPYYCKILFYKGSPELDSVLQKMGRFIADRIPGSYSTPELFNVFPDRDRVKGSERFIPRNFLGQSYLKNGYRADFVREGKGYQVFVLETGSKEEARDSFFRYQEFLKAGHESAAPVKGEFDMVHVRGEKDQWLFHFGRYWGGVLGEDDPTAAEQTIAAMVERLRARGR